MSGMEDLRDLEKQKNDELARLHARQAELESLMRTRRTSYAREMEQIKDFMGRAIKNLEAAFNAKEGAAKTDLDKTHKEMGGLDEKLAQIGKEADWDALERKLHMIEEGFAAEVKAPKASDYPGKLQEELASMRREAEVRLSTKAAEIAGMNGKIQALERSAAQEQEAYEKGKEALDINNRAQLEKREKELRAILSELDRELAKRQLRIGETEKLISARENWVEHEKSRRLERIKSLAEDLDKHARILEDKIDQEKNFWRLQVADVSKEAELLNARVATAQAELQALKNYHRQEMQAAIEQAHKGVETREGQVRAELEQWRGRLRQANSRMQELTGRHEAIRSGYQKEIAELESSFVRQKAALAEEMRRKEAELEGVREKSSTDLAQRMAELNFLREEYEQKILSPILEEKGRHLREIEKEKRSIEEAFTGQEEAHSREMGRLAQESAQMEAKIAELEKTQMAESRSHKDRLHSLSEDAIKAMAPLNEKIGELSKNLELTRKKYSDEMERLDREKSNVEMDVDHKRIAFESSVEEKRKEILFNIENLKANQDGSQARRVKERQDLDSQVKQLKSQLEKLEFDMARQKASNENGVKEQRDGIEQTQAKSITEIERLKEFIVRAHQEGESHLAGMQKEIARLQQEGASLMESLAKAWQAEELDLEKRRIVIMEEINKTSEEHAKEKQSLEAEASSLHSKLQGLQKLSKSEEEKWSKIFEDIEKRRQAALAPLEAQLDELSKKKAEITAKNKTYSEDLGKQIKSLQSELERRKLTYSKECECRREALTGALEELREKRKKQEVEILQSRDRLAKDKERCEQEIRRKEAEMKKMDEASLARRRSLEEETEQERKRLEGSLSQSQQDLDRTRAEIDALNTSRIQELDKIEEDLRRLEEGYKENLTHLEETHRSSTSALETKSTLAMQSLQKEISELMAGNEAFALRMKEMALEADMVKNRREMEVADLERQKRRLSYEMRSKRNELARELRLARRCAGDKLREQEHNLYLARVKFQVRSKRLEETFASRRQELSRFQQTADARLLQSLKNLESQAAGLRARRQELEKQIKTGESSRENFKSAQGQGTRALEQLEREKEMLHRRAKERLGSFLEHVEKMISDKEKERERLVKMLEQMGPFGEDLQRSLTGLSMDWERELRRVENWIKGIEENPIWRQH